MALYVGSQKKKIFLNGKIYTIAKVSDKIRLLSSDKYILKDSQGVYLIPKEDK